MTDEGYMIQGRLAVFVAATFLLSIGGSCVVGSSTFAQAPSAAAAKARPNILFAMADDWGWPHAGVYGDKVVATPTFDALAAEGVLFEAAFCSSPSCTPSRNAILTGQNFFRLGEGANLHSTLAAKHAVFPLLLEDAGYHIGHWRKAWGPGNWRTLGRKRDPTGKKYPSFEEFLRARPAHAPFCFLVGLPGVLTYRKRDILTDVHGIEQSAQLKQEAESRSNGHEHSLRKAVDPGIAVVDRASVRFQ